VVLSSSDPSVREIVLDAKCGYDRRAILEEVFNTKIHRQVYAGDFDQFLADSEIAGELVELGQRVAYLTADEFRRLAEVYVFAANAQAHALYARKLAERHQRLCEYLFDDLAERTGVGANHDTMAINPQTAGYYVRAEAE
jgi:hypothetical protein